MEVTRRESATGWMEAVVRDPHPALRPLSGGTRELAGSTPTEYISRRIVDGFGLAAA